MNKYIVPICNIPKSEIYNKVIIANSLSACEDKIMDMFQSYSDSSDYNTFVNDLDNKDILIGEIRDIETL